MRSAARNGGGDGQWEYTMVIVNMGTTVQCVQEFLDSEYGCGWECYCIREWQGWAIYYFDRYIAPSSRTGERRLTRGEGW
jgi:hypothetical protein